MTLRFIFHFELGDLASCESSDVSFASFSRSPRHVRFTPNIDKRLIVRAMAS
jgi:hypothetical protein